MSTYRAVHIGPSGCRYANRLLPGGTAKNRPLTVDFGRRWSISTVSGRLREKSTIGSRLREKKGRRRRGKEEKRREEENLAPSSPAHRRRPRPRIVAARMPSQGERPRLLFLPHEETECLPADKASYRAVRTGSLVDRYVDRPLPGVLNVTLMYVRVFRVLFILCTTTSGLALGSEGLSTGQEDTKAGTLEEYAHYCHSSCHEESGAQRRLCSCGIEAHDPDSDALIIAKSGDFESY
ncbi:hypothetical protein GW17_00033568 [Ensete ventricosum]|nr:hypothetical protein GW17_00033568 [Ensete ventricosum]